MTWFGGREDHRRGQRSRRRSYAPLWNRQGKPRPGRDPHRLVFTLEARRVLRVAHFLDPDHALRAVGLRE